MVLLGIFGQMDFFARLFVFPGYFANRQGKRGGKKMEAVIYTKSDKEYQSLSDILEKEAELIDIYRDPLDGFCHYEHEYDLVVVALEGARGMNEVEAISGRYPDTQIIWITGDKDFASVAIRRHIHDFIVRPFTEERFAKSVKDVLPKCPHRYEWHFSPGKRLRGRVI